MKKCICLLLILCLAVSCFAGCNFNIVSEEDEFEKTPSGPRHREQVQTIDLNYTMDQDMIDSCYAELERFEKLAVAAEDWDVTDASREALEDAVSLLMDQYWIAYILYCLDETDETLKTQYLDSIDIITEMEVEYKEMCKRVWLSETPFRDRIFEDWTQKEIDLMLLYDSQIAELEKRNEELTVAFRDLGDEEKETGMIPLYNEMVKNNNRIAKLYGYDNYYEYAYDVIYQRDYEFQEIEKLRQYTARYLPGIFQNAYDSFYEKYYDLNKNKQKSVAQFTYKAYDAMAENYVCLYLADLPDSAKENMEGMFTNGRVVFAGSTKSYQGAFTTVIGEDPFCYFGPDYDGSETIIHELGHYYGCLFTDMSEQPMDLAETQSQGNEWLFIHFLKSHLPYDEYECIAENKLYTDLGYIICFVMIDQFEQMVYTHKNAGNLTLEEYETLMETVAEDYGGIDFVTDEILDVQRYWKMVVLESPVYYISYAVSGLAAINLFTAAESDEENARQMYMKLIEEPIVEAGFLGNIQNAGLSGPFEETVYEQLVERYAK